MAMKRICKVVVPVFLMFVVYGCGRPHLIGSDAAVYSGGKLYAVTGHDLNSVYDASVKALEQLEVEIIETAKDVFYAKIVGKIADGKTITIRIEPGEDNITNLSIKASRFISGNKERANVIYKHIKQNLSS